ncbi:BRO family protein [Corynebacterium sp. AOP40-9SA-29]|uniref:BRO family protein n=1 Tax=Corynebacterium sp. AOP40-9SA-29 TaxID=3457677 RepID=UPI0040336A08
MSNLAPFNFNGHRVRVITAGDGEPRWIAADIAKVLGLGRTHDMVRTLDEDERGTDTIRTPSGTQSVSTINESGLYSCILRSRKDEARAFKKWVTSEVLPTIRRTGGYGDPAPAPTTAAALPDRRALAQMVLEAEDRADKATAELEAAAPALEYHDRFIADAQDVITVEDWGRQWGMTRGEAFTVLVERSIVFRKSVTREFSAKKSEVIDRNEYRAYSSHRNLFELRPQHRAPRYHNGQVRQTLYVRASCSFLLANAACLPGTPGGDHA